MRRTTRIFFETCFHKFGVQVVPGPDLSTLEDEENQIH